MVTPLSAFTIKSNWWANREWSLDRAIVQFLLLLSVLFLAKQILVVLIFPPFTGHDEVAHFAYASMVANDHRVPIIGQDEIPDYYYRYCLYILDWAPCEPDNERWLTKPFRFADWGAAGVFPAGEQYVANHPPLYYLAVAPFIRLTHGTSPETQQYLVRLLAIPFGLGIVLLAFFTSWTLFPGDRFLGITVASIVALQPQISYEAAMVNNDIVGIAAISLILYLLIRGMRDRFPLFQCLLLGLAFGASLLVKGNSLVIAPVIALAMMLGIGIKSFREWLPKGVLVAATGFVIAAPWYVFLYQKYGNFDALAQIEEIQQPWNHPAGTFTGLLFNRSFVWARWQETWGAFGWRRIQLEGTILWWIAIPTIVFAIGLAIYVLRSLAGYRRGADANPGWRFERPSQLQAAGLVVLGVACVIAYLAVIQFGTRFVLTQARYFFPMINAVTLLLMVGARTLTPVRMRPVIQSTILAAMMFLNVVIYTRYVIPYWHLSPW